MKRPIPCRVGVLLRNGHVAHMKIEPRVGVAVFRPVVLSVTGFLQAWSASLNSEQAALASGSETLWRTERKFHFAEDCFRKSDEAPVPLAELAVCWLRPAPAPRHRNTLWARLRRLERDERLAEAAPKLVLTIDNGVTRTLWLLANGAEVLPFECPRDSVDDVERVAGASDIEIARGLVELND